MRIIKFLIEREGGIRPTMLLGNADLVVLKADFHTLRDIIFPFNNTLNGTSEFKIVIKQIRPEMQLTCTHHAAKNSVNEKPLMT